MEKSKGNWNFHCLRLQIDLARSSRGVGWANGYCPMLIVTNTFCLARFWARRKPPDTISRVFVIFPSTCNTTPALRGPPYESLWVLSSKCSFLALYKSFTNTGIIKPWQSCSQEKDVAINVHVHDNNLYTITVISIIGDHRQETKTKSNAKSSCGCGNN